MFSEFCQILSLKLLIVLWEVKTGSWEWMIESLHVPKCLTRLDIDIDVKINKIVKSYIKWL